MSQILLLQSGSLNSGLFLLLVSIYVCYRRRHRYGYSRFAYPLSLIFPSLFTISAIVGSVVLYNGQGKFHDSTSSTLDYVVGQANSTVNDLKDVSNYLTSAKKVGVDQVFLPQNVQNNIDKVNNLITSAATQHEEATDKNKDYIFHYLDAVGLILIVVAAVVLVAALPGFVFSISSLQFLTYILVFVGWILVAITFILCSVFLVLHKYGSKMFHFRV